MIARGSAPREECGSTGLLAITTVADSVVKRFSFKREFHGLAKASSVVDLCLRHSREPLRTSNSDLVPDWAELVCIPSLFLQHDHVTYATDLMASMRRSGAAASVAFISLLSTQTHRFNNGDDAGNAVAYLAPHRSC